MTHAKPRAAARLALLIQMTGRYSKAQPALEADVQTLVSAALRGDYSAGFSALEAVDADCASIHAPVP